MYYYHTSTYYSANFDRIGRLKTDLYFKTRQSGDVTASFILFYSPFLECPYGIVSPYIVRLTVNKKKNLRNRFKLQVLRRPVLWDKYN